jgi:hypothetical protein
MKNDLLRNASEYARIIRQPFLPHKKSLLGGAQAAACGLKNEGASPLRCIPFSWGSFFGQPVKGFFAPSFFNSAARDEGGKPC